MNPDTELSNIGRTVLAELDNDSSYPQISVDVTEALYGALQKEQAFSVLVIRQTDLTWRSLQLGRDSAYTLEQLQAIRKTLNCDAILSGNVTTFRPYPHMSIGLHLRLIDLTDGQLIWGLEQIWDSTDRATIDRIKNYYARHELMGSASLEEELGVVSTHRFIKFVVYEVARTLRGKS
jgi:hypothetical protein